MIYITTLKTDFGLEIDAFISPKELQLSENEVSVENVLLNENAIEMYNQLLWVFGTVIKDENVEGDIPIIQICPIMQMTEDIRAKYNWFVDEYKNKNKRILALKKNLDAIEIDEYFFFSNKKTNEPLDIMFINDLLKVYSTEEDDKKRAELFEKLQKQTSDTLGHIFEQYKTLAFDTSLRKFTGEQKKEERICRFCNNENKEKKPVTFKKKAHAVPEALGNKGLVANEECDVCNETFGNTIEKDLIKYLDIYRVFFGISGKNGIPMLEFDRNAIMKHIKKSELDELESTFEGINNDKGMVTVISQDVNFDEETKTLTVKLKSREDIVEVNIYKALCKIAIGLLDSEDLPYLKKTVSWINSIEQEVYTLPRVASVVNNFMYVENPMVALYVRKGSDNKLPHIVGEFKFKSFIYVFIVPFSQKDDVDFTEKENYDYFWNFFKHYGSVNGWIFNNFSSSIPRKFIFNLEFLHKNIEEQIAATEIEEGI